MATANQADFLGEGTNSGVKKPNDPNDQPNPKNPGGISNNQLARIIRLNQAAGITSNPTAGLGGSKEQIAAAKKAGRAEVKTADAPNDVWGDIKKIWTSDPVTTGVLAAPYGIAAGGLAATGAAGVAAGAGPGITTPVTAPASLGAVGTMASPFGPGAAAPSLGAVGTVASPFPAAAAASAAGPAMYAPAAAGAGITARDVLRAGLGGVGAAGTVASFLGGGNGGSSQSSPAGAPAAGAGVRTDYAPSGGYLQPTVGQQSSTPLGSAFSSLSPAARQTLQAASQGQTSGAFNPNMARATGNLTSQNPAVQQFMPMAQQQQSGSQQTQQGIRQVQQQAQQFAQQNSAATQSYNQQASAAANRAAPQIQAPSSANMQSVYNAAANFQPNTSGVAGIRAATADVSGAGRLENYQLDQQGINNLEGYRPTNTAGALPQLENFQSRNTAQGVSNLEGYQSSNALAQRDKLNQFYSTDAQQGADALQQFHTSDAAATQQQELAKFQSDRSGINRLNDYADAPEGPSQAQALLRAQADADKRTALAMARSGRGGASAIAQAQRMAISEGAAIAGETRGQAAALRAQETDTYKQRQLQALAQAGSLISAAEAQRLQGMVASGQMLTDQDAQKLSALQAYAQVKTAISAQQLSAQQAAGQLALGADTNQLGALQSAGQLRAAQDQMRLSGLQTGGQLRSNMDSQTLSAISNAAQLRTQGDVIRSNNLQAAGNIRLQGSEINQRGQIAATQAELAGSAQQLQAMGLQGQIATAMRDQDITVLRSNLDASLQQMNLNDTQVRFFAGLGQQRDLASQNLVSQASQFGVSAQQAQQALDLQYQQTIYSQLSQQQQLEYNYAALNSNNALGQGSQAIQIAGQQQQNNQFNIAQNNQRDQQNRAFFGSLLMGAAQL